MQFSSLSSNNHIISRYFLIELLIKQRIYKKKKNWKVENYKTIVEN